jgi:hypothetical protein
VVAPTAVEAVRASGGWMFDRVMAGWDVMALVADCDDYRPLHILGARVADLEAALTSPVRGPLPHVLALDMRMYHADHRVRRLVLRSLERGLTEVRVWGEDRMTDPDGEIVSVRHRLSVAARAFKTQALAAAAVPADTLDDAEVFQSGELLATPAEAPDLVLV